MTIGYFVVLSVLPSVFAHVCFSFYC